MNNWFSTNIFKNGMVTESVGKRNTDRGQSFGSFRQNPGSSDDRVSRSLVEHFFAGVIFTPEYGG